MNDVVGKSLRHFVTIEDVDVDWLQRLFNLTLNIEQAHQDLDSPQWIAYAESLARRIMVSVFYEPSTRTRFSFEAAMLSLGGKVVGTEAAGIFSSATKGEDLQDTDIIHGGYGQVIVLRHPDQGSAREAAMVSPVPIINAGDGDGEHPTQALLDLYTIWRKFAGESQKTLTLVGDLKRGRTVHSLVDLLVKIKNSPLDMIGRVVLVSPHDMRLPGPYVNQLNLLDITVEETLELSPEIMAMSDIIYTTRTQSERPDAEITSDASSYVLTTELADELKADSIIMHPLPRNNELP